MKAFLSYTRSKDDYNNVSDFRDHLAQEMKMLDPTSDVFQDKTHMGEGDHFPEVIADALRNADVLLVLVSPAWLQSDWCRKEFELFTSQRQDQERLNRILPVLWVNTPTLLPSSGDSIAAVLATINYADWKLLRNDPWGSSKKKKHVAELAERVLTIGGTR